MSKIEIYREEITKSLIMRVHPKLITFSNAHLLHVQLENIDPILFQAIEKNQQAILTIAAEIKPVRDKMLAELVALVNLAEKRLAVIKALPIQGVANAPVLDSNMPTQEPALLRFVDNNIDQILRKYTPGIKAAGINGIKKWKKIPDDRDDYKYRQSVVVTIEVLALVANVGMAIVSAPTGVGSIIFTILGALKSATKLALECHKLRQDAEYYHARLEKFWTGLKKELDNVKDGASPSYAKHTLSDFFAEVTAGLTTKNFMPACLNPSSQAQFEDDLRTFHGKLAGLKMNAEKNNDEIFNLLDAQEKLKLALGDQYHFEWMMHPERVNEKVSSRHKITYAKLQSIFVLTQQVILAHEAVGEHLTMLANDEEKFEKLLTELKSKQKNWQKVVAILFKASDTIVDATSFALPDNQNLIDGLAFIADTAADVLHEVSDSELENLPHGLETLQTG